MWLQRRNETVIPMIPTVLTKEQEYRLSLIEAWLSGETRTEIFLDKVNSNRLAQYHNYKDKERKTILFKLTDIEAGQ